MTLHADAIYEGGVLRPLVPLDLREHELVSLAISAPTENKVEEEDEAVRQRCVLMAYVAKVESRHDEAPQDGLTNRDHDRLIYGQ